RRRGAGGPGPPPRRRRFAARGWRHRSVDDAGRPSCARASRRRQRSLWQAQPRDPLRPRARAGRRGAAHRAALARRRRRHASRHRRAATGRLVHAATRSLVRRTMTTNLVSVNYYPKADARRRQFALWYFGILIGVATVVGHTVLGLEQSWAQVVTSIA